jgi:hypothetical protein
MDLMKQYQDKADLTIAIVDPPYGIGNDAIGLKDKVKLKGLNTLAEKNYEFINLG